MTPKADNRPEDFDRLFAEREHRDASANTDSANLEALDATCMYQEPEAGKKERDVAFALAVIEADSLSERQLANAVKDWTIHGDESLSKHLVRRQLITAEQGEKLLKMSTKNLQVASQRASRDEQSSRKDSMATLGELDPSGRIAHMLGLTVPTELSVSDRDRGVTTDYKLLRKLGQGGMGTVWLARDEKLGRLVAIKEIRKSVRDNDAVQHRFRRESQVTGRLEHPSIVPVHQLCEFSESGNIFYVMRFIGKRTLEDAITEYHERRDAGDMNPMHLHHLLTAFVTVCQAIAYAHSRNVVHRDLKPENIALDDYGQVIVLDWGLAKLTGRGELHEIFGDIELNDMSNTHESLAGQVLGTPMYMSPEQAAGRVDEIEPTTDVYGLGAILFSILTGYAPHELSRQTRSSSGNASELFQAIVSSPAPQPLSITPDAPPDLASICTKAMASKRYARYGNALALAEDVQRWMAGEPVSTYTEPWQKRARRWIGTHHRISQLTGALLTVFLVTAITLSITSRQSRIAEETNRFESLKADGRELEVSLRSAAEKLGKDARFMSALPPIQGIVAARSGASTDSEKVWQDRLEIIYRGLLESNPNYLSASYARVIHEQETKSNSTPKGVQDVVRVERQTAGDPVRVMPESRLLRRDFYSFLATIFQLKPSDVTVQASTVHPASNASSADAFVLSAGTPIYSNTSGELFGVVTLESDLEETIRALLVTTVEPGENAYVLDGQGKVLLHYSRDHDFQEASVWQPIGDLVKAAQDFFEVGEKADHFSDGRQAYGIKVRIDPRHSPESLGVVLTVEH